MNIHLSFTKDDPFPDYKWARINHLPRQVAQASAPDEVFISDRSYDTPIYQKGNDIPWRDWWSHFDEINGAKARAWMRRYESMMFNNDEVGGEIDTNQKINIRCSDGGGNLFAYDAETTYYVRMVCYPYNMSVETLTADDNFYNPATQHLYFYPTAINKDGRVFRIGDGSFDTFIPRIAREKWILKSKCTFFAYRPVSWGVANVLSA